MSYCWEQESMIYGFHPFSGDIGLGLYGTLLCISSFVYYSTKSGLTGCLCDAVDDDRCNMIKAFPKDGIGKRFIWIIETEGEENEFGETVNKVFKGEVELDKGTIREIKIDAKHKQIMLEIINEYHDRNQISLSVRYPADYNTVLTVNGKQEGYKKLYEDFIKIEHMLSDNEQNTVICIK